MCRGRTPGLPSGASARDVGGAAGMLERPANPAGDQVWFRVAWMPAAGCRRLDAGGWMPAAGCRRLDAARAVELSFLGATLHVSTRTLNLHGQPAAAGGVRPGAARASSVNPPAGRFRRRANCPWRAVTRQRFQRAGPSARGVHQLCLKDDRRAVSVYCDTNLVGILKKSPEDWMGHSTMMRTMRYQCDQARGRCWQEEHVARLGTFDAAFAAGRAPRKFGFTDVDGQVERNGCLLVLELKTPGAPLPVGQRIMYEQATRRMGDAYRPYVIWGAPDFSGPLEFQTWRGGRTTGRQPIELTELQARFTNWYRWADRQDVGEGVVR